MTHVWMSSSELFWLRHCKHFFVLQSHILSSGTNKRYEKLWWLNMTAVWMGKTFTDAVWNERCGYWGNDLVDCTGGLLQYKYITATAKTNDWLESGLSDHHLERELQTNLNRAKSMNKCTSTICYWNCLKKTQYMRA